MPLSDDEKAYKVLESAVHEAQQKLAKDGQFNPFYMLLTDTEKVEYYQNNKNAQYETLEVLIRERLEQSDIEVLALVSNTQMPKHFNKGIESTIRVHLEEKVNYLRNFLQDFYMYHISSHPKQMVPFP